MYYDPNGHAGIGACPPPNQAEPDTTLAEGIEGGSKSSSDVIVEVEISRSRYPESAKHI